MTNTLAASLFQDQFLPFSLPSTPSPHPLSTLVCDKTQMSLDNFP